MYKLKNNIPEEIASFVMHEGLSTNRLRQSSSHPHCSIFSNDNKILFISDLGTDTIYWYNINYE
jgi:6-phosphogluconolactonase